MLSQRQPLIPLLPGVQPAGVNTDSCIGPICYHLQDAVDKVNMSPGALILHPLGSAASLRNSGCDGHCIL